MQTADTITMINVLLGVLATFLTSTVVKPDTTALTRILVVVGFSIVGGFAHVFYTGLFDPADWGRSIITVLFTATIVYTNFLKPTGIAEKYEKWSTVKLGLEDNGYKGKHMPK